MERRLIDGGVFYAICRHAVSIMDGWVPIPSTVLSKKCEMSLYQTRKELKRLKAEGLVTSELYVDKDPEWERPILINGYTITEKAKETDEYSTAIAEEREICKEVFGFDPFDGGGDTDGAD